MLVVEILELQLVMLPQPFNKLHFVKRLKMRKKGIEIAEAVEEKKTKNN